MLSRTLFQQHRLRLYDTGANQLLEYPWWKPHIGFRSVKYLLFFEILSKTVNLKKIEMFLLFHRIKQLPIKKQPTE